MRPFMILQALKDFILVNDKKSFKSIYYPVDRRLIDDTGGGQMPQEYHLK